MKCLGRALLPPRSMCSHGEKDESQHLAVGCCSCLKYHLCKRSTRRDAASAVFMKLPFCCLPLPSEDMVHSRAFALCCQVLFKIRVLGEGHRLSKMALESILLRDGLRDSGTQAGSQTVSVTAALGTYVRFPCKGSILPAPMEIGKGTRLEVQTGPLQLTFSCGNTLLYVR